MFYATFDYIWSDFSRIVILFQKAYGPRVAAPLTDRSDPQILLAISCGGSHHGCQHPLDPPLGHWGSPLIISESNVWRRWQKRQASSTEKATNATFSPFGAFLGVKLENLWQLWIRVFSKFPTSNALIRTISIPKALITQCPALHELCHPCSAKLLVRVNAQENASGTIIGQVTWKADAEKIGGNIKRGKGIWKPIRYQGPAGHQI